MVCVRVRNMWRSLRTRAQTIPRLRVFSGNLNRLNHSCNFSQYRLQRPRRVNRNPKSPRRMRRATPLHPNVRPPTCLITTRKQPHPHYRNRRHQTNLHQIRIHRPQPGDQPPIPRQIRDADRQHQIPSRKPPEGLHRLNNPRNPPRILLKVVHRPNPAETAPKLLTHVLRIEQPQSLRLREPLSH